LQNEKEVIKRTPKGMYAFNKHYPAIQISSSSRSEAQKFGYILGLLYKGQSSDETKIRLDDDDLVFLSTCFRPRDVAAALLVELDLYLEDLFPIIRQANEDFNKRRLNKSETHNAILHNRGYFALNSFHKKAIGWSENGAQRAIEKGKKILEKLNQYTTQLDWESYWSSLEILKREDEESKFNELINQMSSVGHRLLFNTNLLEILLSLSKENSSYTKNEKLKLSIDKLDHFFERAIAIRKNIFTENEYHLIENLKKHVEKDFIDFDEQRTMNYVIKKYNELNYELSKLTPKVSGILDEFEQNIMTMFFTTTSLTLQLPKK